MSFYEKLNKEEIVEEVKIDKLRLRNRLMNEIDSELLALNNYAVGDDEKKRGVENVEKLYKILLQEEENRLKEKELEYKKEELRAKIEADSKKTAGEGFLKFLGYVVEGAAIVVPAKVYWEVAKATFVFEQENCVTSMFGKSLPRLLSPKKVL